MNGNNHFAERNCRNEIWRVLAWPCESRVRDISIAREIHTLCTLRIVRCTLYECGSIEPVIWRRYARACRFTGRVQRLASGYTCLPPAIIVSLQGPIIEKPRLLSTPIARCETIFLLGAHEPRRWYVELPAIIVTYHRRAASFTGTHDGKRRTILAICGRHLEALTCTTPSKVEDDY